MTRSLMSGFNTALPPGTPSFAFADSVAVMQAVFAAALGCLYPVAILIVMHTTTVKDYYAAGAGAAAR